MFRIAYPTSCTCVFAFHIYSLAVFIQYACNTDHLQHVIRLFDRIINSVGYIRSNLICIHTVYTHIWQ